MDAYTVYEKTQKCFDWRNSKISSSDLEINSQILGDERKPENLHKGRRRNQF